MIWFNIKELERGLKSGDVSDREIFNYLMVSTLKKNVIENNKETNYMTNIDDILKRVDQVLTENKRVDAHTKTALPLQHNLHNPQPS